MVTIALSMCPGDKPVRESDRRAGLAGAGRHFENAGARFMKAATASSWCRQRGSATIGFGTR